LNDKCSDHRWEKVDAGYNPGQVGKKGTLLTVEEKERKKRETVRTRLEGEKGEKPRPELEALERQISDL